MSIAYAPRGGFTADNFGSVAVGDTALDLHAALVKGDGVIVVSEADTLLQVVLDEMPALHRVSVPEDADTLTDTLDSLQVPQLRDAARERGLKAGGSADDLRAAIRTHDATTAGDEQSADLAANDERQD